jgi:hypothetical protein
MPSMIGHPSPIPHEPAASSRITAALALLGVAFIAFFAALAVLDGGGNTWGLALLGVFAACVAGAGTLLRPRKR